MRGRGGRLEEIVNVDEMKTLVRAAFADRSKLSEDESRAAVLGAIEGLDRGELRVAEKKDGQWVVNDWLKEAILLYFSVRGMEVIEAGSGIEFHDKIPLKRGLRKANVRVVPGGIARYGSFLEPGAILMPGFVNIGARVGAGSMIDTWATVGSCAQVGKDVHVAGGVGIGGVLEPPAARPNIIEDGAFIGSRCIIVEGTVIEEEAVLGANVVITASTPIIDVTGPTEVVHKGRVPARSIVIPGVRQKQFAAGAYGVPCALIIGRRTESTDRKVSLNAALREHDVQA
jgi:2,3,4,5-tetrahydropyridine-2,6-dicarboxylate N-succinyltransferase